ncbi:MAG TPA: hypothetical protein VM390_10980 [Acidimicrobiales bacterium]|nr:hypothetical protein [Acidimicrobiales bacterium]
MCRGRFPGCTKVWERGRNEAITPFTPADEVVFSPDPGGPFRPPPLARGIEAETEAAGLADLVERLEECVTLLSRPANPRPRRRSRRRGIGVLQWVDKGAMPPRRNGRARPAR